MLLSGLAAGIGSGSFAYGLRPPRRAAILYGAGSAAGAALGGQLVSADGPRAAIVAACAATALAWAVTTLRSGTLSVRPGPP